MLLLNKYDILEAKLNSGILFRKFVTSYKDKPNDIQSVLSCMFSLFLQDRITLNCSGADFIVFRSEGQVRDDLQAESTERGYVAYTRYLCNGECMPLLFLHGDQH